MNFVEKILNTQNEEEIENLVKQEIDKYNKDQKDECNLGFVFANKLEKPYNGFIGKNCRIKFSNLSMITYGIKDDSYLYEFVKLLKKNNIKNKTQLVIFLETYLNYYFGKLVHGDVRDNFFYEKLELTTTDDEYFDMIESFDLTDLKKLGIAMCTERGAMAQNIMTLFGFDSYYCMGYLSHNGNTDAHCYNVVRIKGGYRLLDYSVPVLQYTKNSERYVPFMVDLTNEEFEKFMTEDFTKIVDDYELEIVDGETIRRPLQNRIYTNGKEPEVMKTL